MKEIPYIIFESESARLERIIKRLFVLLLITILLLVGTNAYWVHYEAQFEDIATTETTTQDINQDVKTDHYSVAYVNGTGDMSIDDSKTDNKNNDH